MYSRIWYEIASNILKKYIHFATNPKSLEQLRKFVAVLRLFVAMLRFFVAMLRLFFVA